MVKQKRKRVSFSQYKLYKKCPLAYKYQYIDKIGEFKKNIYLIFGTAIHDTVQSLLYILYNRDTIKEDDEVNGILLKDYIIRKDGKIVDVDTDTLLYNRMYEEVKDIEKEKRSEWIKPDDLTEFYNDGLAILSYLKRKRSEWFTIKGWKLHSIEYELRKKIKGKLDFIGFIDIILIDDLGNYHIIDLKTSTEAWGYYKQKDTVTTNQNLLYKKYLSELLDVPLNKINVEYLVLKRKTNNFPPGHKYEGSRLQRFVPSNGVVSVNEAVQDFEEFVNSVFDEEGERRTDRDYKPKPTKFNCNYCEFSEICEYSYNK